MQPRSPLATISVLGLAVLAAAVVAVSAAIDHAQATHAMAIRSAITLGVDAFAPPPSDAVPAMTAAHAWPKRHRIPNAESAGLRVWLAGLPAPALEAHELDLP